jgi:MarR family 2-MHQ and catechol resistance regulon transcriptional repressor
MQAKHEGTAEEILALESFTKLLRAVEVVGARLIRSGVLGDLTTSQFGVLQSLHHVGPMNQTEISGLLAKSSSNITTVIDNLERGGLVRRERQGSDRRCAMVSLTPEGEDLISRIVPGHVAAIVEEMSALTVDEQEELVRLCGKLGGGQEAQAA